METNAGVNTLGSVELCVLRHATFSWNEFDKALDRHAAMGTGKTSYPLGDDLLDPTRIGPTLCVWLRVHQFDGIAADCH